MKRILSSAVVCLSLFLGAAQLAVAAPKSIVGRWAGVKGGPLPEGAVMEFTADKKIVVHVKQPGGEKTAPYGTYEVKGDKVTLSSGKDTEVNTIKVLTDEKMVLVDPKGQSIEFHKAK
jgi:uncharacterized protein (TIGR03066 family)